MAWIEPGTGLDEPMEMHQVRYFLAVAEHLNFTRAAERLHVAQPSLTRAIQKLEDELGGPLFCRERANTHLTELGRLMRPHLQMTLGAAEAAKRQAQSFRKRETGQLTVGACSSIAAETGVPLLARVSAEIGELALQVEIGPADLVEEKLIAGDIDAALLAHVEEAAESRHERFDLRAVAEDMFCVAFAPGHRFEASREVVLEDLDGEPLIVHLGCRHEDAIAAAMKARSINRPGRPPCERGRALARRLRSGGPRLHPLAGKHRPRQSTTVPPARRPATPVQGGSHDDGGPRSLAGARRAGAVGEGCGFVAAGGGRGGRGGGLTASGRAGLGAERHDDGAGVEAPGKVRIVWASAMAPSGRIT
ncbi:LysR family transcriptional regulator [Methylobacterium nonmethylotrophicum]|uniref:LysR family transcriptional regulator n=1 Tax=Methylobacterium nonmethylotrophicum TaxID=1141884 RepID=UPI002478BBB3|nr:LysR family transcriptional regulator [Methylobacterium nonmethylotrophicum]